MAANSKKQRGPGRPFVPGQSGNPSGRPKGFGALVREGTKNGQELVDKAVKILRSKKSTARDVLEAIKWLADRGWGKALQPTEPEDGAPLTQHMTDDELVALVRETNPTKRAELRAEFEAKAAQRAAGGGNGSKH